MNKIVSIAILSVVTISCSSPDIKVKDGDIVFQTSLSSQSKAIQLATKSKWSHMGMILTVNNEQVVFEAVEPVKYTSLKKWIKRGENGKIVIKRLKDSDNYFNQESIQKIKSMADSFLGKHYDLLFEWSDDKMYCSEIVWKIYNRVLGIKVGELQRLRDFDLSSPFVQRKMKERYHK